MCQTTPVAAIRPPADPAPPRAPLRPGASEPTASARRIRLLAALMVCAGCAANPVPSPSTPAAEIPALEARAARNPADVDAAVRLGAAYRDAGRLADARRVLEAAHERAPRHGEAILLLGLTAEDQDEPQRARQLYEAYVRAGASRRMREELRGRLALLERRARQAEARDLVAREREVSALPPTENSVAVFPFHFSGGDETLRPLERALAEFLSMDLAVTGRLTVLERSRVQLLLDEIGRGESGAVDPATAARGGRLLRAERVVQGQVGGTERALEVQARVDRVNAAGAQQEGGALAQRGGVEGLFEMEKALALGIHERLGVELSPAERERVLRRPTANLQAVLAYGRGLESADAGDFARAAEHFREAASLDPGFAAARQRAQSSQNAARAAAVTTAQLSLLAGSEGSVDEALESVQALVPGSARRDPAAEALGQEGFRDAAARVELIFRRP